MVGGSMSGGGKQETLRSQVTISMRCYGMVPH